MIYCSVCTFPPEYCEFGGQHKRCKDWLENAHPDLYLKIYSTAAVSSLSLEKQEQIDRKVQRQVAKEEAKAERELAKKLSSTVSVKRIERNRRKHIVIIAGLDQLELDLKKLAKTFASRFATGASVTKNAEGKDEIVIQGDVAEEAKEWLDNHLKEQSMDVKVEVSDEKKRKK